MAISGGATAIVAVMTLAMWASAFASEVTYTHTTFRGKTYTCTVTYTDNNDNQLLDWGDRITAIACAVR